MRKAKNIPIVLEVWMTRDKIDKCTVRKVLVDTGATKNIIYLQYFKEMGLKDDHLKASKMALEGFTTHKVPVKGTVKVQVTLGDGEKVRTEEIKFYMVNLDSPYNAILGTPLHAAFDLVISTSHQQVKFNTLRGVGFVKSSPRSLLGQIMKIKRKREELVEIGSINSVSTSNDQRIQKILEKQICDVVVKVSRDKEFDEVIINPKYPQQRIKIGREMPNALRQDIIDFLKAHQNSFTWCTEDMPGIDTSIAEHALSINAMCRPIKQKPRQFGEEKMRGMKEEVEKLLKARFIRKVKYPTWLANVVMVKKANGKWRMCVDYTDLYKACPKDCYPLP